MSDAITSQQLAARIEALPGGRRLIAIAGPPASGKSHFAEALCARLNARAPGQAAVVPMDGFHFDDGLLAARGDLARKGAPHTFDAGGLRHLLLRLRDSAGEDIAIPLFDRALEISRAGAAIVPPEARFILVEGNYLLYRDPPWSALAGLFDLTVRIDVPMELLRARLEARWSGHGFDAAAIEAKLEQNDLPNARVVMDRSAQPDLVIDGTAPV